ncbi:MAG TPA: TonB-dependent receptor [Candidatus Acidoferrales bacterium]|nr:TonB-dependent receptor [Candidatus Acidoferrales bacterium]
MSRSISRMLLGSVIVFCALALVLSALPAWGQQGAVGTVSVVVVDQSGAIVRGAQLTIQDLATNDVRKAVTDSGGIFTFTGLPIGTYKLTVNMTGFAAQVYDSVIVQGGRETPVKVTLKVGAASEEVVVSASETPILETGSNAIATTIDMKQIEDLPLGGRDVSQLAFLTPGYSGTPSAGTWDGMPVIAQSNTIDGVVSSTSRMKFAGNTAPGLQARLEDIQEMTVATSQMDVNQGFGAATMQSSFVTKRGSNSYHGEVYEDFRNSWLNANDWFSNAQGRDSSGNANAPRSPLILNDFGGSVGGPILKDKLFFYGSFAMSKQPGGFRNGNVFLTPLAQSGVYTYQNPNSTTGTTVNLYSQIATPNGLPATPNVTYSAEQAAINTAVTSPGASVCAACTGDPNTELVTWFIPSPQTMYFPAMRLDYNISQKYRLNFAFEDTKYNQPGASAPPFPGSAFASQAAFNKSSNYTSSLGFDWTISPALLNQFKGGYYYNWYAYGFGAKPLWDTQPFVGWGLADSGTGFSLPVSTYYPIINASDNATWQHSAHTVTFGFSFYREQDHYWNPPDGIQNISLGLAGGDPALTDFDNYFTGVSASNTDSGEAENLYATLVGRIAGVTPIGSGFPYSPSTGQYATTPGQAYNLDELQKSWGLYAQDSFHMRPTLTVNYGLRWDFVGDDHDLTSAYHGTSLINMYGPTLPGQIFKQGPSTLSTNNNPQFVASSHQYAPWNKTPQPTLGVAWSPNYSQGFLGRFLGGGKTVIRAGFDIKRFTEPYQYFWNNATNRGLGFFQFFSLTAQSGGAPGTFTPGTLALAAPAPGTNAPPPFPSSAFLLSPPAYQTSIPMTDFTWSYYWGASGFDPKIQQPYVQEWNLGIQREIGHSNVLEVRYMGHRSVHQWISTNPNEVNILENGFLNEFKNAQNNYTINLANGFTGTHPSCTTNCQTFADNGFAGQVALPIFDAAFAGEASGGTGAPFLDYNSGSFVKAMQHGSAGSVAATLAKPFGNAPYICNLTGSNISSCASQFGFTTPGAYPVNFFQTNPYAASCGGCSTQSFMTAGGYGDYHALAIDFRERPWHGMQFDANYTWSHTLGLQPDEQWLGTVPLFTMRNLRLGYGPTLFDLRHVFHASGTVDLPFGYGKTFLNHPGVINQIVGGWTLGTIFTYETGFPFNVRGGFNTFNDFADGGLVLSGVTRSQLQSSLGVFPTSSINCDPAGLVPKICPYKQVFNSSVLGSTFTQSCSSNLANVCQNIVPGTLAGDFWLHGPHLWNDDMSLSKVFPIRENVKFVFQSEFLNAFNHPNWANPGSGPSFIGSTRISSGAFGQAGLSNMNSARQIEFRARLDF